MKMIHILKAPDGAYALVDATHSEGEAVFAPATTKLSEKELRAELADMGFTEQSIKDAITQADATSKSSLQLS